ncbi:MAG: hypothetical protein NTV34_13155, partial [Proteobacteria bacterium]|nr:hypothetical protein [Pseudomonadota bacterium]
QDNVARNTTTKLKPWLRTDSGLSFMRRNRDMSLIAYVPIGNSGVRIMDTKNAQVYEATNLPTGGSFFWAPDNTRLFFRELTQVNGKVRSAVRAWDAALKKSIDVEAIDGSSGLLSFDPRDQRLMLMHDKGIMMRRLLFPDERLAHWQSARRSDKGKWIAAAGGMTFLTQQGFSMEKLADDESGIESFDISPTGNMAVWATNKGKIFASRQGESAKFIDFGRDPQWHPEKELIVFAGARMVGNKASSYDIKIAQLEGPGSFLTTTQARDERWPIWAPKGNSIVYTLTGTTDVFTLKMPNLAEDKP